MLFTRARLENCLLPGALVASLALLVGCSKSEATATTPANTTTDLGSATGSDAASDVAKAGDTPAATDAGKEVTGPPKCVFPAPVGARCNPYPQCDSGCAAGDVCTIFNDGTKTVIDCRAKGDVSKGGTCDHTKGPWCAEGACVQGKCRRFCVDPVDCSEGGTAVAACDTIAGVPGKPTACGEAHALCEPLTPDAGCGASETCYLEGEGGLCMAATGAGKQGATCTKTSDCVGGLACVKDDAGALICGALCNVDPAASSACDTACTGKLYTAKASGPYGACYEPKNPPPTCDLVAQDCQDSGKGCYLAGSHGMVCLPQGAQNAGDACQQHTACKKGLACAGGKCVKVCDPKAPAQPTCGSQAWLTCNAVPDLPAVGLCNDPGPPADPCNVVAQDCKDATKGCYSTDKGDVCLPKGTVPKGGKCDKAGACVPGLYCLVSACRPICDPKDAAHATCDTGAAANCVAIPGSAGGYCDE